ncbi:MAG: DUF2652 domain-containing protein [Bacteroidota bacterium]
MAETNATILIPDISGFTEFMTTTELNHSSHAINMLIEAMLKAVGDEYEVSEIEGDALLLIKKGAAPSRKEIYNTCIEIFSSFHIQRMFMQQHAVCPCGACQAIINLTLKFIVHHGPLAEIKVGRFVKQSGTEMIVAHRLLKNSIASNEYLLMTEKLLHECGDSPELSEMTWTSSEEEYPSIGKVGYSYALLNEARKKIPEPPAPENTYQTDDTSYLETSIGANFMDVYMVIMNIPGRAEWQEDLKKVEQEIPGVFVGSIHYCSFENFKSIISPLRMNLSDEGIVYAESCRIEELNISLVHEFVFKKEGENSTKFSCRFINAGVVAIPEAVYSDLLNQQQLMAEKLKTYCEKLEVSVLEPLIK